MKKYEIAYYVSSHGFGHLTRSLALMEYILETTKYNIYICSGERQIEFAKIYLSKYISRIKLSQVTTDIGLINKVNSLDVDVESTNEAVSRMLNHYDDFATQEAQVLELLNVRLVISDVSAFACLVAKKINVRVLEIGNFTWVDQYISIGADPEIIEQMKKLYSYCSDFIAYDLSLDFVGAREDTVLRSDYIVSRPIVDKRVSDIKEKFKTKYYKKTGKLCENILYLSLGKSAQLPKVHLTNFEGIVFYTEGIVFNEFIYPRILFVKLPHEIKDSQSFVAAADLVIGKAGWSTAAEGVVAHTKTLLIERPDVDDDTNTINCLKEKKIASSITIEEVINLDYKKMYDRATKEIDMEKLNRVQNDTQEVCDKILSYLD